MNSLVFSNAHSTSRTPVDRILGLLDVRRPISSSSSSVGWRLTVRRVRLPDNRIPGRRRRLPRQWARVSAAGFLGRQPLDFLLQKRQSLFQTLDGFPAHRLLSVAPASLERTRSACDGSAFASARLHP
jgi:hypothetical protein